MPYSTNKELPKYVQKYSEKVQSQFRHVFNTVYEKTKSEERAFKAANSVLKTRMDKRDSLNKNSRQDIFQSYIDRYLGNLNG